MFWSMKCSTQFTLYFYTGFWFLVIPYCRTPTLKDFSAQTSKYQLFNLHKHEHFWKNLIVPVYFPKSPGHHIINIWNCVPKRSKRLRSGFYKRLKNIASLFLQKTKKLCLLPGVSNWSGSLEWRGAVIFFLKYLKEIAQRPTVFTPHAWLRHQNVGNFVLITLM